MLCKSSSSSFSAGIDTISNTISFYSSLLLGRVCLWKFLTEEWVCIVCLVNQKQTLKLAWLSWQKTIRQTSCIPHIRSYSQMHARFTSSFMLSAKMKNVNSFKRLFPLSLPFVLHIQSLGHIWHSCRALQMTACLACAIRLTLYFV